MLTKDDFTSNDVIDKIQLKDTSVGIVGYVAKVSNNCFSQSASKFYKLVVSNAKGRDVQVIAWNDNIKILNSINEMGTIVHVSATKAEAIRNSSFNLGNVNFELIIKENSKVKAYGILEEDDMTTAKKVPISEVAQNINKKIKVEGIIKVELKLYKNQNVQFTIGSLTDMINKLEIKANFDCSELKLKKGTYVEIIGMVDKAIADTPILNILNLKSIKEIKKDRISFTEVLNGFTKCTITQ